MGRRGTAAAGACFSPSEADTVSVNYRTECGSARAPLGFRFALYHGLRNRAKMLMKFNRVNGFQKNRGRRVQKCMPPPPPVLLPHRPCNGLSFCVPQVETWPAPPYLATRLMSPPQDRAATPPPRSQEWFLVGDSSPLF